MSVFVADLINGVTLAFLLIAYEWAARRLARKSAQPLTYARKVRVALLCAFPFLAWSLYVSLQPWSGYSLAFLLVVAFHALMLYVLVRWISVIVQRRRRRRSAARAEALLRAGGQG